MQPGRAVLVWAVLIWAVLAAVIAVPVAAAAVSPLLAWREPVYIAAGFAGIAAMAFMLVQPLLARGYLPGLCRQLGRQIHRAIGALLVLAVAAHVGGLWITSPPDMVDALLFRAPTWFSVWGVVAMWAVFAAALLAVFRRRLRIPPRIWRRAHTAAVTLAVTASVAHAMLIEGTMELISKAVLCALVLAVTLTVVGEVWGIRRNRRA